jgi:hypothetical protein
MERSIFFSFTRESDSSNSGFPRSQSVLDAARQSIVCLHGSSYPLYQRASNWRGYENVKGSGVSFDFHRPFYPRPFGEVEIEKDLSFSAWRELLEDEKDQHNLFLESLVQELVYTTVFFNRFISKLQKPGSFRVGLGFFGLNNFFVDWAGFAAMDEIENYYDRPRLWRLKTANNDVQYDESGIGFPYENPPITPLSNIVLKLIQSIKGIRRTPLKQTEHPLCISLLSIQDVIEDAFNTGLGQ